MRRPLSIAVRLALLFSAIAALTFVAAGAYLYQALGQQMARRDDDELLDKIAQIRHILRQTPSPQALRQAPDAVLDTVYGRGEFMLRLTGPDGATLAQNAVASRALPPLATVPLDREPGLADLRDWRPALGEGRMLSAFGAVGGARPATVRIILARERSERLNLLRRYGVDLLVALCGAAALAALLGLVLVRRAMRPLHAVIGKANDISTHRLNSRLSVHNAPAELQALGEAFNAMLDRLEEGVQRLSGFAADLAHDLRTPIHTLMGETQVALARPRSKEDYQTLLGSNLEEYERLARMIENMLFLARIDNAQLGLACENLSVETQLCRIRDYFEGLAEDAGVSLAVDLVDAGAVTVSADPILLQRAVSNLVSNAIRHTPRGGAIALAASHGPGGVEITVSNTGPGIAAEHLPHIFERYYRADPARSASAHAAGLGLAIVHAIMSLHGGTVDTHSEAQRGTCFTLRFNAAARGTGTA
ncbi:MAG TPA: two-component sensor histidine kinase [Janthinobacterium sp.]|nr:two-component sensor histidine kinase [Janthinobacterium sp.]